MRSRRTVHALTAAGAVLIATVSAAAPAAGADVDDFSYASWDAQFQLSLDDEGRADMRVTETLVAEFPEHDQNRGIVRGLPLRYQGASTDATVLSVTDEDGAAVPFETEDDDGVLYILTGNDEFVHGEATYVIEYRMSDVIIAATETNADEFYWDLLPLDSRQSIEAFSAEITVDDALGARLTGDSACYVGSEGSTDTCALREEGATFEVTRNALAAGDGVTVAIGFESGTVTQPPARQPDALADVGPLVLGAGAILLSAGGWIATSALIRSRRRGRGVVVAQYEVPDSLPPVVAAAIVPKAKDPLTAQIVHLAVRGLVRLEELPEKKDDTQHVPRIRRLDRRAQNPVDEKTLSAVFDETDADTTVQLPMDSEPFAERMQELLKSGKAIAESRGLTTTARSRPAAVLGWFAIAMFAGALALSIWGAVQGRQSAILGFIVAIVAGMAILVSSFVAFSRHTVLTSDGALALEHLEGVREFIRVAEQDRLRMLQSFSGAERRPDGGIEVIHIYERLLPYAILFGQEREWGDVLERAYAGQQQSPAWVDGSVTSLTLRMAAFAAVTTSASSYSSPTSGNSSGLGGSTGGGFSGGGGGGGFSGGR